MSQPRSKNIDVAMCRRVKAAFKRLGMTYKAIALDAGIPSQTQLIEVANGVMEPSKRVLRYLCSKGFSAQWLFMGEGPELWMGKGAAPEAITRQVKKDIITLTEELQGCSKRIDDLRVTLKDITNPRTGKRR